MTAGGRPCIVVLAGPNGAGKSTVAPALLKGALEVTEFVNADVIARGLSGFDAEGAALAAGRVMLARLHELAQRRSRFAFETTMASRSFAPWIAGLVRTGYAFHAVFLWLPSPEFALARVADRVRRGGHGVPHATVRRRYRAGLQNFFAIYRPLATTWRVYDNSGARRLRLVARGRGDAVTRVMEASTWEAIRKESGGEE